MSLEVLLIEDNPGDAKLIGRLLEEAEPGGFHITAVSRLSTGERLLLATRFDVVLLDLSLPESSGLQTVVRLKTLPVEVPIVVVSGLDDLAIRQKAIQMGVHYYVVKGAMTGDELAELVRRAAAVGELFQEMGANS